MTHLTSAKFLRDLIKGSGFQLFGICVPPDPKLAVKLGIWVPLRVARIP
jgi:hypothetical protein